MKKSKDSNSDGNSDSNPAKTLKLKQLRETELKQVKSYSNCAQK